MWFKKGGLSRRDDIYVAGDMYLAEVRRGVRKVGGKRKAIKVAAYIGAGVGLAFLATFMVWLLSLNAASHLGMF